jgi:hypothetical protein
MELCRPPPDASNSEALCLSPVTALEWSTHLSNIAPKLMCLAGGTVYKFSRSKVLKQKWQDPSPKTLIVPAKGFVSWTDRQPVRYVSASTGASDALDRLM